MKNTATMSYLGTSIAAVVLILGLASFFPVASVHADTIYNNVTPVSCTITTNESSLSNGQAGYLSWVSYGATSASLSDGIGIVAPNGTMTVRPASSRTYTLTVYGVSGQVSQCSTVLTVNSVPVTSVVPTTYAYGTPSYTGSTISPTVSLTQIPYTGLDWSTSGIAMAWLSLIGFAGSAAYLLYYYRLARA